MFSLSNNIVIFFPNSSFILFNLLFILTGIEATQKEKSVQLEISSTKNQTNYEPKYKIKIIDIYLVSLFFKFLHRGYSFCCSKRTIRLYETKIPPSPPILWNHCWINKLTTKIDKTKLLKWAHFPFRYPVLWAKFETSISAILILFQSSNIKIQMPQREDLVFLKLQWLWLIFDLLDLQEIEDSCC